MVSAWWRWPGREGSPFLAASAGSESGNSDEWRRDRDMATIYYEKDADPAPLKGRGLAWWDKGWRGKRTGRNRRAEGTECGMGWGRERMRMRAGEETGEVGWLKESL